MTDQSDRADKLKVKWLKLSEMADCTKSANFSEIMTKWGRLNYSDEAK